MTGQTAPICPLRKPLVLASASPARKTLLENAGLEIRVDPADLDEGIIKSDVLDGASTGVDDVARILAQAKADTVSARHRDALVLGCDQTLEFGGELISKPTDMDAARRQLLSMRGQTHRLHTAAALVSRERMLWQTLETVEIEFRDFTPAFVGRYMSTIGNLALTSVGGYQIEGLGVHLMKRIEGDYFSVLGLPLLAVLAALRDHSEHV